MVKIETHLAHSCVSANGPSIIVCAELISSCKSIKDIIKTEYPDMYEHFRKDLMNGNSLFWMDEPEEVNDYNRIKDMGKLEELLKELGDLKCEK